jgi:hypothetical protein
MIDGEDIDQSPDNSMRMPHSTTITNVHHSSERQDRFIKDRLSSIHQAQEHKFGNYVRRIDQKGDLEEVKEEPRDSESRIYYNKYEEETETEVVAVELEDSADLARYGMGTYSYFNCLDVDFIPKETYHNQEYQMRKGYNEDPSEQKYQEDSPELAYNYHDELEENVMSSEGESGFTSFDSI